MSDPIADILSNYRLETKPNTHKTAKQIRQQIGRELKDKLGIAGSHVFDAIDEVCQMGASDE